MAAPLDLRPLRRLSYVDALEEQMQTAESVRSGESGPVLMLVEHDPVFTFGKNASPDHLLADAERLDKLGIKTVPTDRGGEITYHGPGQLVGYPIFRLDETGWGVRGYIERLQKALQAVCRSYGVDAEVRAGTAGLWTSQGKVAAIGLRVDQRVTRHGFALNVDMDLSPYQFINPCGEAGAAVTDLTRLTGSPITLADAADRFGQAWSRILVPPQT